ncbi:MAG: FkbM family methyltransferase [Pseudomonadota bacterium]|nr:FkbM family methyltransferase [Pseudomonadota bacterium]
MRQFESYAQNGEDVRLNRCFGGLATGTYIDVGSSEPTRHSPTYALYRMGWRGIAIEPLPDRWRELEALRSRDINLNIALSDQPGSTTLFRSLGRGGTSTIVQAAGEDMRRAHEEVIGIEVQADTLANICSVHLAGVQSYEILKIDVEGAEGLVLAGADFASCRPIVIIAEGPRIPPPWEEGLVGNGYVFITHDGVNRWYACSTRRDIAEALEPPVSVNDRYLCVDQYGSPFRNLSHPDQSWSAAFALTMVRAVRTLDPHVLTAAYLERFPEHMLIRPADAVSYSQAVRVTLGRRATEEELALFRTRSPTTSLQDIYRELVSSEEFGAHRGRVIGSV